MTHTLVYDEKVVRDFIDKVLPDPKPFEKYFVSLSARNKYLTDEEKIYYSLGRSEMFSQQTVSSKEGLVKYLRRFECSEYGYLTKSGLPIPAKAMVVYLNLFLSNVVDAYTEFTTSMTKLMSGLVTMQVEGKNTTDIIKAITKSDKLFIDCMQRNRGTCPYIDVDFDFPEDCRNDGTGHSLLMDFLSRIKSKGVQGFVLNTHSGYHVLLKRETLKYNYNEDIQAIQTLFENLHYPEKGEVVVNKNLMIPFPGTSQGGYPVSFYEF